MSQHKQQTCAKIRYDATHGKTLSVEHEFLRAHFELPPVYLVQEIRHILRNYFNHVLL